MEYRCYFVRCFVFLLISVFVEWFRVMVGKICVYFFLFIVFANGNNLELHVFYKQLHFWVNVSVA